jgi:hypothetical protein
MEDTSVLRLRELLDSGGKRINEVRRSFVGGIRHVKGFAVIVMNTQPTLPRGWYEHCYNEGPIGWPGILMRTYRLENRLKEAAVFV